MTRMFDKRPAQEDAPKGQRLAPRRPRLDPAAPRPKVDLDACPSGWDPEIWSLVLLFEQLAAKERIQLHHGRFLIYALAERRIEWLKETLASAKYRDENEITVNAAGQRTRAWYGAGGEEQFSSWQELAEAVIRREWKDYWQDEYSAEMVFGEVRFREILGEVRHKGYNKRLRRLYEEQYGKPWIDGNFVPEPADA